MFLNLPKKSKAWRAQRSICWSAHSTIDLNKSTTTTTTVCARECHFAVWKCTLFWLVSEVCFFLIPCPSYFHRCNDIRMEGVSVGLNMKFWKKLTAWSQEPGFLAPSSHESALCFERKKKQTNKPHPLKKIPKRQMKRKHNGEKNQYLTGRLLF